MDNYNNLILIINRISELFYTHEDNAHKILSEDVELKNLGFSYDKLSEIINKMEIK